MRIRVTGERPVDAVTVNGTQSRVVTVSAGLVSSVMGQTGAVTGLALSADVVAAQAAAEADATAKVAAHTVAADPHGDRAWASGQFLPLAGGTLAGPVTTTGAVTGASFNTDGAVRSGNFRTNSDTEHALTVYQRATGTSPGSVALNVISDKPGDSAMWLSGKESARGTLKIAHLNPGAGATADASAAAISIDLQRNGMGGTAAQGIFLTSTEGPTTGRLLVLRNSDPATTDDFVVNASGLTGIRIPVGNVPAAALEVRQRDTATVGLIVQGAASTAQPLFQVKTSGGTATLEVGTSGAIVTRAVAFLTGALQLGSTSSDFGGSGGVVISMKNATTAPTTNPTDGVIAYSQGGVFKVRSAAGVVFDTTRRTVTGAKGGNAALTSLLTQLATIGLITDSTT
ncbi:hypothetical protein [Streptomyces resistomycificus]|uniref:hypothetical protein n=2 Tax=Streptomyces resistomycificus TaxID=67356 RepID=UPI00069D6523|nr:hypothetical protein [Streptomyces resistomycificus]KUN99499.1 hypothetical protein AQJ84_11165 [Streptomyces resistomycificus]